MEIMSVREAAEKWGLTERRVTEIVRSGRIPGAKKLGQSWVMPADTKKPIDKRLERKNNAQQPPVKPALPPLAALPDNLSKAFLSLITNTELVFQIFDMYPFPIEIFTPNGISVYLNRAWMELFGITDTSLIVGKFNVKNDPASERLTGREFIDRMLAGEAFRLSDISAPVDDHVERGVAEEKAFDAAFIDVYSIPVWDGDTFAYAVCMLMVRETYKGKNEVARAIEYINEHLTDEFDLDKTARAATLSRRHFQRMFKDVTGLVPFDYYKKKKIDKLQEKLLDPELSVTAAFAACGVDSNGTWYNTFKNTVGETPSQFRKKNNI